MIQLHIMTLAIDLGIEGAAAFFIPFAGWWGFVAMQLNSVVKTFMPLNIDPPLLSLPPLPHAHTPPHTHTRTYKPNSLN